MGDTYSILKNIFRKKFGLPLATLQQDGATPQA
jgi:hypothetical protein